MTPDLPDRMQALYSRLNDFPEAKIGASGTTLKPDAWAALLDLRQLLEREVMPALHKLRAIEADLVEIPVQSMGQMAAQVRRERGEE